MRVLKVQSVTFASLIAGYFTYVSIRIKIQIRMKVKKVRKLKFPPKLYTTFCVFYPKVEGYSFKGKVGDFRPSTGIKRNC